MTKKYTIHTLGCRVNQYESISLSEEFSRNGWEYVPFGQEADVAVINTCAVTQESERKSMKLIRRAAKQYQLVAAVGCFSKRCPEKVSMVDRVFFVGGCGGKNRVVDAAQKAAAGKTETVFHLESPPDYEMITIGSRKCDLFSECRAYIKIQDGCGGKCAYCIIPSLRGVPVSRSRKSIVDEAKRLAACGYREVVLTGIELSDFDGNLVEIIRDISEIDGIERIRTGSLSPEMITSRLLRECREVEKFMPAFHISIQSGSGRILREMRRRYSGDSLRDKLSAVREIFPDAAISADMITGFPTESPEDFDESIGIVKEFALTHIHAFPYSPRPGTASAQMRDDVPPALKKQRVHELEKAALEVRKKRFALMKGQTHKILVESNKCGIAKGHTEHFFEAQVKSEAGMGEFLSFEIKDNDGSVLFG